MFKNDAGLASEGVVIPHDMLEPALAAKSQNAVIPCVKKLPHVICWTSFMVFSVLKHLSNISNKY